MRQIKYIVIHCTATPEGKPFTAADIARWHREKGWAGIGYHRVIRLDGTVEQGRRDEVPGAHVSGHNMDTLGVVYVGGCDKDMKPKDTRTQAQKSAMGQLVRALLKKYPLAKVCGHRDFPGVKKACPSFDVAEWWKAEQGRCR